MNPLSPHRPADPVRGLLHRHRELCERAVDPLEIAAALEAHGITDRVAARFRHRDVFSLAEELYARVPRTGAPAPAAAAPLPGDPHALPDALGPLPDAPPDGPRGDRRPRGRSLRRRTRTVLAPLLPGLLGAAALGAPALAGSAGPAVRPAAAAAGCLLVPAAVRLCLRGTALGAATVLAACWLAGYALVGDGLLALLLSGWAGGLRPSAEAVSASAAAAAVPLSLAIGVAPAVWCARWFALRARRRLAASASLEEFAAGARSLLLLVVGGFTACLLAVFLAVYRALHGGAPAAATTVAVTALGALLFTALLLASHGFPGTAAGGLGAACAAEAAALASVLAARLPGLAPAGRPVELAVAAWGPAAVPAAVCTCAALVLLFRAATPLTGASAHHALADVPPMKELA